jgi:PAS domain S-box-containing protein
MLAAGVAAGISVVLFGSLWFLAQRGAANLQSQSDSQEIARDVANLLTLTQEYTFYRSDRAIGEWRARYERLRLSVERAADHASAPDPALDEMRERVLELLPLYQGLENAYREGPPDLAQRRRELIVERLLSEAQELVDARYAWAAATVQRQAHEQRVAATIMLAASALLVAMVAGIALLVGFRVLMPLARLQASTAAIQRGDLSTRCESAARDELGDTARAVNAMAESLLAANTALQQSEERYQLAVIGSNEGLWDWNLTTNMVYLSPPGQEIMLGRVLDGVDTRPESEWLQWFHIHPDDADMRVAAMRDHLRGITPRFEGEWRVRHPDDTYHWIQSRGICVRDASGRAIRFVGSASDIDARKRAEDALKRSQERYALAVEAAGDGHIDWIVATDEIHVSPRLLEMCGFPVGAKFSGRADFLAQFPYHPEDRERAAAAINAHYASSATRMEIEARIVRRGETRWLHITLLCSRDASGALLRSNAAITDVTEARQAEEALRRSDARKGAVLETALDCVIAMDQWGRIVDFNPAAERTFGVARSAALGRDLADLIIPQRLRESYRLGLARFLATREPRMLDRRVELTALRADGTEFPIEVTTGATQLGGEWLFTAYLRDLTELKAMERKLRLAQRLEAMGTLAGGIAHDFNNILGAILGYGEMALRDAPGGNRLQRDLDSIMTAGERGRALVDRVLAFSRSGLAERVAVHVEKVVREALDLLEAKLPEGIRVEAKLRAGRAAIMGDPTQVHQVLMNLGTNAVQAMPSGGTLRVSLEAVHFETARAATVGNVAAGEYVVLAVADTGTGIAREVVDRIFDPFFSTKEVGTGTGLGLSLVHSIVTELGGAVDVASTPGAGSEFTVYLPRSGEAAEAHEDEAAALPRGEGERVLIVDDEEPLAELAVRTLEDLGYVPTGFTSSTAALAAFRADPEGFDAVITDERMPGMTGSALIRELRGIRGEIPILLMSGYVGGVTASRAREAGASEVMKKPLSAQDLATSLARVLRQSALS